MQPQFTLGNILTRIKTGSAVLASFLFFVLAISGCERSGEREHQRFGGETMGTTYNVTLVAEEGKTLELDPDSMQRELDELLVEVNQQMSTYIDDSELMRFNRSEIGQWHRLSGPLTEVLSLSQSISKRSDGAFDITVAPLVNLWGFGPQGEPEQTPGDGQLERALADIGYEHLKLEGDRARRVRDIHLDLSGIAKGFGVDQLAEFLESRGYQHFLVEIGGEVRLSGESPRGGRWRIGIEQPAALREGARKAIALTDIAMATSGDYRNYYERDGQRYSHTIDPRNGRPIQHKLVSVTVLAPTSAEADAWATALNVLGAQEGMRIAEREKLAVYMIVKEDEALVDRHSEAFEPYW